MTGVLVPAASEAEWLEARRKGVTASEIAVIMGLSPYGSPFELYHRKTGALPPSPPDTEAMERGRVLEPYVAQKFEQLRRQFVLSGDGRVLYAHPDRPWQMATPDRLVYEWCSCGLATCNCDPVAVLETKTSGSYDGWGDDGTDEIPVHYRCQVLWQMQVMGVAAAFVACLFVDSWKVRVYDLAMDGAARSDLKVMQSAARRFLERIDHGDPPDVDWRPATTGALKALHPTAEDREVVIRRQLAISYRAACRRYKEAERRKDEVTNRILAQMGSAKTAVDARTGEKVAGRQVYDVRESVRKAYTVNKLVPARAPKEHTS